ncbi:unnamed protein product [Cochlearia groenlandica]
MESASTSHKRKKIDENTIKKHKRRNVTKSVENNINEKIAFGVFEFPWMKESMIPASLDWSLPESDFIVEDSGNEMFEEIREVRWPMKMVSNDYNFEFETFECIWSAILEIC